MEEDIRWNPPLKGLELLPKSSGTKEKRPRHYNHSLGWFKIFTLLAIVLAIPNSCSCDVFRETCKVLGSFAKV